MQSTFVPYLAKRVHDLTEAKPYNFGKFQGSFVIKT